MTEEKNKIKKSNKSNKVKKGSNKVKKGSNKVNKVKKGSNKVNKVKKGSNKGSNKVNSKKGSNKVNSKKGSNKVNSKKGSNKVNSKKGSNKVNIKINRNLSRADIIANPNLLPKYLPDVITVPIIEKSIFDTTTDTTTDIKFNEYSNYPKNSIGFQHFIHAMKHDTIKELATFENKKKVYEVLFNFELYIDNYNESIGDTMKKHFNTKETIDSDFFKLWEMFFMFDLINDNNDFVSTHIDDDGSGELATKFYRELIGKNFTKNTKDTKNKSDFITINNKLDNYYDNAQEQQLYKVIFNQIVSVIKIQKKGGAFICKISETYTDVSIKLITMIASLYDRVYLCKPLTSKPTISEKFIVAQGFKYSDSDNKLKEIITKLDGMNSKINQNNKLTIIDIFPEYLIPEEMKVRLTLFNELLMNKQFKAIGQMITFIYSQNFYGDTYQKAREEQIEAAKFWNELFFMSQGEYKQNKAKINDMSYISNKINLEGSLELKKKLNIT